MTDLAVAGDSVYVVTLDLPRAIVYRRHLPTSANSPIAVAGNTVIVPAGGPRTSTGGGSPQVVAYVVR